MDGLPIMNHGKTNWILASTLITVFVLSGCAGMIPPPPFPTEPNAENHYDAGERFLEAQRYEMAAAEYEKSLEFESGAYNTHTKLAVAYFGQQKFGDAAKQFEATYHLWGGASSGEVWALIQAVSLQRAGDDEQAEELLRQWTRQGVMLSIADHYGAWNARQPLRGHSKLLARYLVGDVDEDSVLVELPKEWLEVAYMTFGLSNAAKGDTERAGEFLQLAEGVISNRSGWSIALVRAEMRNLEIGEIN